jgi:hypothetical protein
MRPPAPMTPTRRVSLAPRTRVEARAVIPVATMKVRRFIGVDMASILAERGRGGKIVAGGGFGFEEACGEFLRRDWGAEVAIEVTLKLAPTIPTAAEGVYRGAPVGTLGRVCAFF